MRRDLTLMYGSQALRYLAPLILVPFYGRTLGIAAYGQLLSAMALMQIAWVVVEWGLTLSGLREVAGAQSDDARARLVGEQIAARLALTTLVVPACFVAAVLVPALNENLPLTLLAVVLGVANAFNMTWYFQGRMEFRVPPLVELCGLFSSTALILWLVNGPADAWLIPGSMLLVSLLSFAVQLHLCFRSAPAARLVLGSPLSALKESTLLFVDRGQAMLLGPLSILLLGFVAPAAQVAWFAVGERLLGVMTALLGPLNQIFMGMLSNSVAEMRQGAAAQRTYRLMRNVCTYSTALYVLIACAAFAAADQLVPLVFGPGFEEVVPVFRILSITFLVWGVGGMLVGTVLYPLQHDREIAIVSTIRLASTLVLVMFFGALLGSVGGAWGRLLGASLALLIVIMLLNRRSLLAPVFRQS